MWWVVGIFISMVIFITYALCVAAGDADRQMYKIEAEINLHSNTDNN